MRKPKEYFGLTDQQILEELTALQVTLQSLRSKAIAGAHKISVAEMNHIKRKVDQINRNIDLLQSDRYAN